MRLARPVAFCIAASALCLAGCEDAPPVTGAPPSLAPAVSPPTECPDDPGFGRTYPTPDALASAFLTALREDDAVQLSGLALDEREFRCRVWPFLPASRPERGLTVEYVWGDLHQKSLNALAFTRQHYGRRRLDLTRVAFAGESTDYGPIRVHRETRLTVIDEFGRLYNLRLFGSMLEADGRYKVFSFVTD